MEKSTAMFDKEKAQERLSKLSGGVAVLKVNLLKPILELTLFLVTAYSPSVYRLVELVKLKLVRRKTGLQML